MIVIGVSTGGPRALETLIPALMALLGGGMLTRNVLRLGQWADEREAQMEHIATRARALLEAPPE